MRALPTISRPLVLIVEDDPWIRAIASELLNDEGYETASATNGQIGLSMAEQLRPAVILLDLGLPGMSGAEFLRYIDHDNALRRTPVIVVTGQPEILSDSLTNRAADVLTKPFDVTKLLERVNR